MLLKCCTKYVSKFEKLSSGHRTGKGRFSFQSQRRAMPKNVQTTDNLWFSVNSVTGFVVSEGENLTPGPKTDSVTQLCPTLCDSMNCSTPGLPVHHQLPEFTQTHVHQVSDAIQPSHPLSSLSPPAPNPSQHQSLFQ